MNMRRSSAAAACALIVLLSGCKAYQYQIIEPHAVAGPVERDEVAVSWSPLEYQLVEYEGRLALRVANPMDQPITLLGERSYIVDPSGETQPIQGGTIAPHSRVTMALPPARTYAAAPRASVGIGVGTGFHGAHVASGVYGQRWVDHPRPYDAATGGPYWQWTTGQVRMRLIYEHRGEQFEHDFTFDRIRIR